MTSTWQTAPTDAGGGVKTIGSLFSGYGGLDLAAEHVYGARTAWHCEIDPGASKVLAARWPEVPNHNDLTSVDWAAVEPVDILTGGFPCQDVSSAGKRLGLKLGTRSGLWQHMAYAIDQLRPQLVVTRRAATLTAAQRVDDGPAARVGHRHPRPQPCAEGGRERRRAAAGCGGAAHAPRDDAVSRSLPVGREQALQAIADGWGREATHAHPMCRCGKPYRPGCRACFAKPNQPCVQKPGAPIVWSDGYRALVHGRTSARLGTARDCPMHRTERRPR